MPPKLSSVRSVLVIQREGDITKQGLQRYHVFSSCNSVSAIRKHVVRMEESRGKNPKPNVSKLDQIQQQSYIILPVTVVSRKTGGGKGGGEMTPFCMMSEQWNGRLHHTSIKE
jgi:hypothetical protein